MKRAVEEISRRGDGIAKIQGFIIFIPETEIGEQIRVRVTMVSSRHATAERIQQIRMYRARKARD